MSHYNLFSKRKKAAETAGKPDVYQYTDLPKPFRVQVIHIWKTALGFDKTQDYWAAIYEVMTRELGVFNLGTKGDNVCRQCQEFLLETDTDHALDLIELTFRVIDNGIRSIDEYDRQYMCITQDPSDAITELNYRFKEHAIGYQYIDGLLIRVDSEYTHEHIIKPALALLHSQGFAGPSDEFMRAHEHYRHGRHKEAIAEASKAFESTLKAICQARKWNPPANATVKPLLDYAFNQGLVPAIMAQHLGALRSTLESGLPTLSNRTSRHGQGASPTVVSDYVAAYALRLTATNIIFLVDAHMSK